MVEEMCLMIFKGGLSALSALDAVDTSSDDDFGIIEEWIPPNRWIGMVDAFLPHRIGFRLIEPCL
jgi:hypothetical protein